MASYLHRHHPCTNRPITDATGAKVESAIYKPFGAQTEFVQPGLTAPESKGWIGQRYDADAGLQYLNARYYDPVLGMFLQPDWFEVLQPGVGTNRFSYSFNDPVNFRDPSGNFGEPLFNWVANGLERLFKDTVRDLSQRNATASQKPWSTRLSNAVTYAIPGARNGQNSEVALRQGEYAKAAGYAALSMVDATVGVLPFSKPGSLVASMTTKSVALTSPSASVAVGQVADEAVGGVYRLLDGMGNVMRNGRTNDLLRREGEHLRNAATSAYEFVVMARTNVYEAQRGLEQHYLDLARGPLDRIRGIAVSNPRMGEYMSAARNYLGIQ